MTAAEGFVRACALSELEEDTPKRVELGGVPVSVVLTEGARADSVPNLEIETGEIEGAGHASATGRFDDEQLFYLQARGIPEDAARRLVVSGFFNDIIGKIGVPEVTDHLHDVIEEKLARAAELSASAKAVVGQ